MSAKLLKSKYCLAKYENKDYKTKYNISYSNIKSRLTDMLSVRAWRSARSKKRPSLDRDQLLQKLIIQLKLIVRLPTCWCNTGMFLVVLSKRVITRKVQILF